LLRSKPFEELSSHIKKYKGLEDIPKVKETAEKRIDITQINDFLPEITEELTILYSI